MDAIKSTEYFKKIRDNNLFTDINDKSLLELIAIANPCYWPERTCILQSDQELHKFYIITLGIVKAYDYDSINDREIVLSLLTENDVLNVCSLIGEGSTSLYYETLIPTEVLYIPLNRMREWSLKNPLFFKQILVYVLKKMNHLEDVVSDICLKDTSTRLAKLLLQYTNKSTNKIETIDGFTHNQLAGLIGTTRAVLNRHLQEFKEEGILDIRRKHIEIIDSTLLYKKASHFSF
ncbi:Crp/Fnr family transcriptional regulator [Arenibacter certesii]|uniref:Crp/Fnr family transcriptional regulator n=1 Tax=Arenibacter certesii TaxID=228955 RepID=A0A918IVD5_9FLAO|nr:Crp/Fnr family transcriptional regulator [Arenibacter certesii]GGW32534.1 hypothetical protein GCM10007383_17080 [Arenibacter certesii]